MLVILTFQSKQHASFAVRPWPAPGVTLLTPGSWPLFVTLQSLTLGVTAVIEKLSRHVLLRGPFMDHLVEGVGLPYWSPKRGKSRTRECEFTMLKNNKKPICASIYHSSSGLGHSYGPKFGFNKCSNLSIYRDGFFRDVIHSSHFSEELHFWRTNGFL